MISDSMSKSVNPYLAMTFRELYYVWDYDVGTAINEDFILEYNPDIVIMLYYPETIKTDSMVFDFSSFSK